MGNTSGEATKLEWVTCPKDATTFQVAVPAKVTEIRVRDYVVGASTSSKYRLSVHCPQCSYPFTVETDVPAYL
jgi:hypothetical protein